MALQYGLNNAADFASSKLVSFASVLTRTAGQPMDKSSLWYPLDGKTGLERAQEYAASTSAYVGQELAVIDVQYDSNGTTVTGTTVKFYGIQDAAGTLKELGGEVLGDDASIAVGADGKVGLYGFTEATTGTLPQVTQLENGSKVINWVPISSIIEGDTNTITVLEAEDNSVKVTDTYTQDTDTHKYKVKAQISSAANNALEVKTDGLYVPTPVDYSVTVSTASPEDATLKHYIFSQNGQEIAHIDIPKDLVVESGTVIVAGAADKAIDSSVVEGDTYIKLVISNQSTPIYINVKDLIDVYGVDDTDTVDMTITGTTIKADVKVSAEVGNSLVKKNDGLYVNAPEVPNITYTQDTSADIPTSDAVDVISAIAASGHALTETKVSLPTKKYVDDKVGGITIPDVEVGTPSAATPATEATVAAIVGVGVDSANKHKLTLSTQEVATKKGLDDLAAIINGQDGANGLADRIEALEQKVPTSVTEIITGSAEGQLGIEEGAQVNKIESVALPDGVLDITSAKEVEIPYATDSKSGVVKNSTTINTISFSGGIGTVNTLSTDKLEMGEMTLVLNGGDISVTE